jgi:hypothetical protein
MEALRTDRVVPGAAGAAPNTQLVTYNCCKSVIVIRYAVTPNIWLFQPRCNPPSELGTYLSGYAEH